MLAKLAITGFMALAAASAKAGEAEAYKYQIRPGGMISASCTADGQTRTSQIKVYLDSEASGNLVWAIAKVRVCASFVGAIKDSMLLALPVGIFSGEQRFSGTASFPLNRQKQARYYKPGEVPDTLVVTRAGNGVFDLKYVERATGLVRLGPIRVTMASDARMESLVQGIEGSQHLGIARIEIFVPGNNITLVGDLKSIAEE